MYIRYTVSTSSSSVRPPCPQQLMGIMTHALGQAVGLLSLLQQRRQVTLRLIHGARGDGCLPIPSKKVDPWDNPPIRVSSKVDII